MDSDMRPPATPGAVQVRVGRTASRHPPETPDVGASEGVTTTPGLFRSQTALNTASTYSTKYRPLWAGGCMHVFVRSPGPPALVVSSLDRDTVGRNTRVQLLGWAYSLA
jgi:hypothetical protein